MLAVIFVEGFLWNFYGLDIIFFSGLDESELAEHITKLHEYNEIKDTAQMVLGHIGKAKQKIVPIVDLFVKELCRSHDEWAKVQHKNKQYTYHLPVGRCDPTGENKQFTYLLPVGCLDPIGKR